MKRIISVTLSIVLTVLALVPTYVSAKRTLPTSCRETADIIAEIVAENWDEYGVLPSIAVAQAFQESTLGLYCRGNNLWGIASGAVSYSSLEEGVYGYMKVINNGYYKGAPGCKDYHTQIKRILDGGYCVPVGDYYENVIWAIQTYGFDKYDKKMFAKQKSEKEEERLAKIEAKKEKKRIAKQKKTFTFTYDASVPVNAIRVNKSIIKRGAVCAYENYCLVGIFDVIGGSTGYDLATSDEKLVGRKVKLVVHEEAMG